MCRNRLLFVSNFGAEKKGKPVPFGTDSPDVIPKLPCVRMPPKIGPTPQLLRRSYP